MCSRGRWSTLCDTYKVHSTFILVHYYLILVFVSSLLSFSTRQQAE